MPVEGGKHQLDRLDRKILDILQREGRIAITELAARVGLTTSPCAERVRRMERAGVITGYHAQVSPAALDKPLLVFVEIKLAAKGADVFDAVRDELLHMADVLECHLVSGDFDYLLKFRLRDMREYRSLLGAVLKRLPVAAESRSFIVMEEIKESLYLPIGR